MAIIRILIISDNKDMLLTIWITIKNIKYYNRSNNNKYSNGSNLIDTGKSSNDNDAVIEGTDFWFNCELITMEMLPHVKTNSRSVCSPLTTLHTDVNDFSYCPLRPFYWWFYTSY